MTWRRQRRKKKLLFSAWHLISEEERTGEQRRGEERRGRSRGEKKRIGLEKRGKKRWKDLSWSVASVLSVTGKAHLRSPTLKMADVEAD